MEFFSSTVDRTFRPTATRFDRDNFPSSHHFQFEISRTYDDFLVCVRAELIPNTSRFFVGVDIEVFDQVIRFNRDNLPISYKFQCEFCVRRVF